MIKFDLSKMAKPKRGRSTIELKPISSPLGIEREYERILLALLNEAAAFVKSTIVPQVDAERTYLQMDAAGDRVERVLESFDALMERLRATADGLVRGILSLAADKHTDTWLGRVRSTIGVDLRGVVSRSDLDDALSLAAKRNSDLIKAISDDTSRRVAAAVTNSLMEGGTAAQLREDLNGAFSFGRKRSKLIARDQTAKLTTDLNRLRQTQAGVDRYKWSTSKDERVRASHRANEGKIFSWAEPPASTGHPGHDVQCRCVPIPIVEF